MSARQDSWSAPLSEQQAWELYAKARLRPWAETAEFAAAEYGVRKPSMNAFYRWKRKMAETEHAHNLEQSILAQKFARKMGEEYALDDEMAVKSLMATATDAALVLQDAHLAEQLIRSAMSIRDRSLAKANLELRQADLKRKEEELALAKKRLALEEAKNAKALETVSDDHLSPDEKLAELDRIFGRK